MTVFSTPDKSCRHERLGFASGGFYVQCADCMRQWALDADAWHGSRNDLTMNDLRSAAPSVGDDVVEKLARIIDPDAWEQADRDAHLLPDKPLALWHKLQPSLNKAKFALAVLTGE